jgi:thiamine pyrophosphate-dependent acetolactate synthase large subunit-like protein
MTTRSTLRAGDAAVEVLARAGIRRFYTVPGESFLEVLDAVEQHPRLSLVSTRHESGAAFMAEADAKLTGVPAVAMATRGVGASNLAIGVHTARQDSTPMVVLLGQVETAFLGREAFQEVDLAAFYAPITKWAATVHRADRVAECVERALHVATSGRPGPVMLALPADILGEGVTGQDDRAGATRPVRPVPSVEEVREIARLPRRGLQRRRLRGVPQAGRLPQRAPPLPRAPHSGHATRYLEGTGGGRSGASCGVPPRRGDHPELQAPTQGSGGDPG